MLLARVIPPRHHRRVQAVVEHLVHNARAHLLHSLLLQRMRMPALKRGGCGSMGPMSEHTLADALTPGLPPRVISPRFERRGETRVEHMPEDHSQQSEPALLSGMYEANKATIGMPCETFEFCTSRPCCTDLPCGAALSRVDAMIRRRWPYNGAANG